MDIVDKYTFNQTVLMDDAYSMLLYKVWQTKQHLKICE